MEMILSIIALIASGISLWQSHQAQTYSASLGLAEKRSSLLIDLFTIHHQLGQLSQSISSQHGPYNVEQKQERERLAARIMELSRVVYTAHSSIMNSNDIDAVAAESLKSNVHVYKIETDELIATVKRFETDIRAGMW